MQQLDYIVVGLGIAGITICERLGALGKTFAVVNKTTESATRVAGGTINPVVLKRLTAVWKANGFLNEAVPFYKKLNTKLSRPFYKKTEIKRIFHNVAEQNDWGIACGNDSSTGFLVPEISKNNNPNLRAPFGFGTVQGAAFVNTTLLLDEYAAGLRSKQFLMEGAFEHQHLDISKKYITYKNIKAGKIIFAEGTGVLDNPYFGISCTVPKKGEYLIVKAPGLKLKKIVKGPFFIIP
ncbi:MAG: FAD-dependent oxidoreductase, partial [Marinirhabdus sp.]